jgi:hypothetical protein
VLSNVPLPLFTHEPECRKFILRARNHTRISDGDGNLANPSQNRGDQSLANLPFNSWGTLFLSLVTLGKPGEKVVVETLKTEAGVKYWRDSEAVHHVPKRRLEDVMLG